MVARRDGHKAEAEAALNSAATHYGIAENMAHATGADSLFYPAKSGVGAELRAAFLAKRLPQLAEERLKVGRRSGTRPVRSVHSTSLRAARD